MFYRILWPENSLAHLEQEDNGKNKILLFLSTPLHLEKLMMFGFLISFDCLIFFFTLLPLRAILSLFILIYKSIVGQKHSLDAYFLFDSIRGLVLLLSCTALYAVNTSFIYHNLRMQSIIKSYVVFNMLEVVEKLLTSFGQDFYDTTFSFCVKSSLTGGHYMLHALLYVLTSAVYTFLHSFVILCQAVTLNSAVNSHNLAVLTIMISNQFVELKSSVFRKFDDNQLFEISCVDIKERLHVCIFLLVILVRNLDQFSWNWDYLYDMLPSILLIYLSEYLIDWVKHAFIIKSNKIISAQVYRRYRRNLANDLFVSKQLPSPLQDHSRCLSKRMGLQCLPLACVVYKVLAESGLLLQQSNVFWISLLLLLLFILKLVLGYVVIAFVKYYVSTSRQQYDNDTDHYRRQSDSISEISIHTYNADSSDCNITRPNNNSAEQTENIKRRHVVMS